MAARGEGWQREGAHLLLDPLEDGGSCGFIRAGQQNGELIPADPREEVTAPRCLAQHLGTGDQRRIPGGVPSSIVQPLELVDIEQQHRQRGSGALLVRELALKFLLNGPAVA